MKRFVLVLAALSAGALLVLGAALAHGPGPTHPGQGRTMNMSASHSAKLWIFHVSRGCHSWSDGNRIAETVRLTLNRGGRLVIVNEDVDVHRLVQIKGRRVPLGGLMMMNHSTLVVFPKAGLYRFKTEVVEMKGMHMSEVKTVGPDHELALVVRVK